MRPCIRKNDATAGDLMDTHRLVLPGDLNHYGFLFGGRLLAWVDEAAWIAASIDFPHCQWVTVAMNAVEFHHSVRDGTILRICCNKARTGTTSVTYDITVTDERASPTPIFSTAITLVNVDENGTKLPIDADL